MKLATHIVPLRPQICGACKKRSWILLQADEGILPWLSSSLILGAGLYFAWKMLSSSVSVATDAPAVQQAPTVPVQVAATAKPKSQPTPTPTPTPTPMPKPDAPGQASAAAVVPSATPEALPTASTVPSSVAQDMPAQHRAPKLLLRSVGVARKDARMEVVLDSDGDRLSYKLTKSRFITGYVLDLTGNWTLARAIRLRRQFTVTNLAELSVDRQKDHVRIIFSLRDEDAPAPIIESEGGRLRILVQ